jgi:RNA polymerase sigma-70 factor (ECF subfamily)
VTAVLHTIADSPAAAATEPTDLELVRRGKAGDFSALEALTSRYEEKVFGLAWRMLQQRQDAEDVTQQTFLSVVQHLGDFRGEASFSTWVLRIATHAALKVIRKRRGLDTVSLEAFTEDPGDGGPVPHPEFIADWRQSPAELATRAETRRLLDAALQELDEKHRLVFLLRDVEGFSVKETAAQLGLSEVNVKVRLLRARLALRERLTRAFGDPAKRLQPHQH